MKIKSQIRRPLALVALVALLVTGCIVSGQFVVIVALNQRIETTHDNLGSASVDVTGEPTWQDHKDDIQSVVDVKFEARFQNNHALQNTGEVWVSSNGSYTTVPQVQASATRVLSGIVVPGNQSRDVSFTQSAEFIENLDVLLDLVATGKFYVYGIAGNVPFDMTILGKEGSGNARLLVTFSAGT